MHEARGSISRSNCSPSKDIIKATINHTTTAQNPTVNIEGKAKVRARAKGKSDGAQVQHRPMLNLGNATLGPTLLSYPIPLLNVTPISLEREINRNQTISFKPQFLGPRNCLQAWKDLGATQTLLKAISTGVKAPLSKAPVVHSPQVRNEEKLHDTIGEYLQSQAIRLL